MIPIADHTVQQCNRLKHAKKHHKNKPLGCSTHVITAHFCAYKYYYLYLHNNNNNLQLQLTDRGTDQEKWSHHHQIVQLKQRIE